METTGRALPRTPRQTFAMPAIAAAWVVAVGGSLLLIVGRSPYTHDNLADRPDAGYARTVQTLVGAPGTFGGAGISSDQQSLVGDALVARGRTLMVNAGCASCHGPAGRGGGVGPPIAGFGADDLRAKTSKGPGGMPAFGESLLPDDDLIAIATYLQSTVGSTTKAAAR